MATTNAKFNLTVSPMWNTQTGNLMGIEINDEIFDNLQQVRKGGKLFIKFTDETKRKGENSPHAYLEFISPESVKEYKAKAKEQGTTGKRQATPTDANEF